MLLHPDGQPFYIGKGSGNRIAHHEAEVRRGHDCPKCNIIRAIWQAGGIIGRSIVFETDDEQAAFDREAELIGQYDLGILANKTVGRAEVRGYRFAPEQLASQRQLARATYRLNSDFPELLAHLGYSVRRFCVIYDLSEGTIRNALRRHAAYRGGISLRTAWRITNAYAAATGLDRETAYQAIIIIEEVA